MKILIAGDWHGCTEHATAVIRAAHEQQITTVIHVGDLGVFWPGWDVDRRSPLHPQPTSHVRRWSGFTGKLSRAVQKADIDFRFIDGNHDNHDFLGSLYDDLREAATVEGLTYQPRGSRLTIGGVRFGFLGGAGSIDRRWRTEGEDWWPQEQITTADVDALCDDHLDVLIAHEVPAGVAVQKRFELPILLEREMEISRDHLARAVETTDPRLVFSGHWHQRLTAQLGDTEVHVLDMERTAGNAVVLETDDLSVEPFHLRS